MRVFTVPVVGLTIALAACQDGAASNAERQTHMDDIRAAADPWAPLPPAPSNATATPLVVALPAIAPAAPAPPSLSFSTPSPDPPAPRSAPATTHPKPDAVLRH